MRKIGSAKETEEKKKKNMIWISAIMLAVLVFGTVGYAFSSYLGTRTPDVEPDLNVNGKFRVEFEGQNFYLTNSLEQVENVPVETTITLNDYVGKNLYFDAENFATLVDAVQFFSNYAGRVQEACYGSCERDIPEKDCTENIIIWKESEENKVYQEENCVFIEGDERAVDAFIYKIMGLK